MVQVNSNTNDLAEGETPKPPERRKKKKSVSELQEVLARSTSIKDELEILKKGTDLYKIRDKGGVMGIKEFKRKYRLNIPDLQISYTPNKNATKGGAMCAGRPAVATIDIGDICEVRAGHNSDTFNTCVKKSNAAASSGKSQEQKSGDTSAKTPKVGNIWIPREKCFSIVFKDNPHNTLDLVAEDQAIRDMWVDVLSHMVVTIRSLGHQKEHEMYLKKQFQNADKNQNGSLTFDECKDLIGQLNIKMPKEDLKVLFDLANVKEKSKKNALDQEEFVAFYYSLLKRPELEEVFLKYVKHREDGRMLKEDLMNFMKDEQKTEMLEEECEKIIEAFEPKPNAFSLSIEGFAHFMMFSEWQEITDPKHTGLVYQDMNQPLSHYFIASSHNTYLTGNQVTGESSIDAYINALKRGCRCVELDCWDGDDGEPIIYHGWTLTSKILFKEVMSDAILPYAFVTSDYPLILSIENHCSLEQQDKLADYMTTILKDYLYTCEVNLEAEMLPSPEFLKRKILVKAKRLPEGKTQDDEIDEIDGEDDSDERDEAKKKSSKKGKKSKKISKKLSDCVNYIHAVHFHNFEDSAKIGKYYHMSSFGETKATKFVEDEDSNSDFIKYNSRQISRIYPGAKRQDSSNLKPVQFWNAGCQIVALNYQTEDKPNLYNRAQFLNNGGCGYILKPEFLRNPAIKYSALSPSGLSQKRFPHWKVDIQVLSGQHIPKPDNEKEGEIVDPYVKVRIRGHPDDSHGGNKGKTEHIRNNGFNPVWKSGSFHFEVKVPQLAFLEVKVKDHSNTRDDKDIATFCCPLKLVQEGYRRVPLENYAGRKLSPAALLFKINITEVE